MVVLMELVWWQLSEAMLARFLLGALQSSQIHRGDHMIQNMGVFLFKDGSGGFGAE